MYTPYLNGNCIAEALPEGHIYMWMILLELSAVNAEWDLSLPIIVLWHCGDFSMSEWYLLSVLMWMMQSLGLLWSKSGSTRQQLFKCTWWCAAQCQNCITLREEKKRREQDRKSQRKRRGSQIFLRGKRNSALSIATPELLLSQAVFPALSFSSLSITNDG